MKLLRGKRVGPRNPVARGFSLCRRTAGRKQSGRASASRGPSSRSTSTGADAFVSRPEDAAAGSEVQARRPEGREMAGGRWLASCGSPVVSRLGSGSSPDRGVASPFGDSPSPPQSLAGQDPARVSGVDRRTLSEWADELEARIAGTDPLGTGGSQRVGRSPTRPVLKHGPRSLTCARVNGS